MWGSLICAWTLHNFEGINVMVLKIMHQFIMYILGKVVQSVSKERVECSRGWGWDGFIIYVSLCQIEGWLHV